MDGCIERIEELVDLDHQARTLIVVLPDPLLTPFAREFDIFLLAVQQAMAAKDFHLDQSCLVWRAGSGEGQASGEASPQALPKPPAQARKWPGVLVYRGKSAGEQAVFALVVVGEVPPEGVSPEAMGKALELVTDREALVKPPEEDGEAGAAEAVESAVDRRPEPPLPVTILGPTFSGSARSLGLALRRWNPPIPLRKCDKDPEVRQRVTIVSGSATNTDLHRAIESAIGPERLKDLQLDEFRSVATPNDELQSCLWNRVVPLRVGLDTQWEGGASLCPPRKESTGTDNDRVALLVELSAFGRQFEDANRTRKFKVITFPPHLGAIRNAYEELEKQRERPAQSASRAKTMLMTDLTSRLQQGLSMFGRDSTLSSLDLVLNNSLRELARERVQVVGIVATSVTDKIFLAEKVRRFVPDVRMVTVEGDVLLSHPRHYPSTSGMLVVSSSPLAIEEPTRLQFDFDWAQGVYEATRQLIDLEEPTTDRGVFVSVVSRTGLTLLEEVSAGREATARTADERHDLVTAGLSLFSGGGDGDGSRPIIWRSLVYVVSALLVLLVLAGGHAFLNGRAPFGIVPLELIDPQQWGQGPLHERDHVLHALVALLPVAVGMFYFVIAAPAFSSESIDGATTSVCLALLATVAVYLWAGLAVRTAQALWQVFEQSRWNPWRYFVALLPGLAAAGVIVVFIYGTVHTKGWFGEEDRGLFVERLLSMSGGVSPLVPVTLIASVIVAWLVVALRWRVTQPPAAQQDLDGSQSPKAEEFHELWQALDLCAHGWMKLLVWVAVVLIPMLYLLTIFGAPPLRGIEQGPAVDWVATALLSLALWLSLGSALSAALAWRRLRDLLGMLVRTPRLGIDKLPRVRKPVDLEPLCKALKSAARSGPTRELLDASQGDPTLAWWLAAARWLDRDRAGSAKDHALVLRLFREATGWMVGLAYRQLGTLMTFATLALITLFLAIGAYPFEPRRMVLLYLGLLVVAVATVTVTVIVQSRNEPLLEDITGADGSWASKGPLFQRLGFYAGLPAFGLLTARFPELRGFLSQWLDPIVMALK